MRSANHQLQPTAISPQLPDWVSAWIAAEAGAETATLDPLETQPAQGDYLSQMRTNLETVRAGQACS